jgi:lycopene cyclase domain-containing protein
MLGHWTYLTIILVPGISALIITWILGRQVLAHKIKEIMVTVALLTLYLVVIDLLAIYGLHIWSFRADSVIGIRIAGDYIEEWILFVITQIFIVSWAFILKEPKELIKKL